MKPNHTIDLSAAVENAAAIVDVSASTVTQCVKSCDVVITCDVDSGNGNPPVTQCDKLSDLASDISFSCDISDPRPK